MDWPREWRPTNLLRARIPFTVMFSRSEEHTSELQSQSNLVCRLLLEKKKKTQRQAPLSTLCGPPSRPPRPAPSAPPRSQPHSLAHTARARSTDPPPQHDPRRAPLLC